MDEDTWKNFEESIRWGLYRPIKALLLADNDDDDGDDDENLTSFHRIISC
jgi:hypothetical protein